MRINRPILSLVFGILLLCGVESSYSAPAYPHPIEVVQPDGSRLRVLLKGDEFFHYKTTVGGDVICQGGDGFYYYASYDLSGVKVSNVRVVDSQSKSFGLGLGSGGIETGVEMALRSRSKMWSDLSGEAPIITKGGVQAKRGVILVVQYQDVKLKSGSTRAAFDDMSNKLGYSNNGATGSAKDYFRDNSNGQYDPDFDIYGPYTLPNNMAYYGANDENGDDVRPREMIADACKIAEANGVDFGKYDADGNGEIDMVYVYYAGYSEAEGGPDNAIWPHKWSAANLMRIYSGKKLGVYACSSELRGTAGSVMSGIGTFCHEFSHVLGLSDMYDTDGTTNGKTPGLGTLSIMSSGNYNNNSCTPPYYNIFEREMVGWTLIPNLMEGSTTLNPVHKNGGFRIPSSVPGEYFILEARDGTGWDRYQCGSTPVKGMLIYHVDRSSNRSVDGKTISKLWETNKLNTYTEHQCMRVVPAVVPFTDGKANVFFPGSANVNKFTASSHSMAKDWDGVALKYQLTNITQNENDVTFMVRTEGSGVHFRGKVFNAEGVGISGATVKLTPVGVASTKSQPLMIKSLYKAEDVIEIIAITSSNGEFSITDIDKGRYEISVAAYGFVPKVETINIQSTIERMYTLTKAENGIQKRVSHAGALCQYYLRANKPAVMAQKFTPNYLSLEGLNGKVMNAVYFYSSVANIEASIYIKVSTLEIYRWTVTTSEGFNVASLPSPYTISDNWEVELGVSFNAPETLLFLDEGPAVAGYGDLLKLGDDSWSSLKRLGFDYNICMGFWTDKGSSELDVPQLNIIEIGQRDIKFSFYSEDANVDKWQVSIGVPGNEQIKDLPAASSIMKYDQLNPKTLYNLTVSSFINGKKESVSREFTTLELTAPYVAISMPAVISATAMFYPKLINMPRFAKRIKWTLNGNEVSADGFNFKVYGDQILEAEITWENNTTEIVTRKFNLAK